MSLPSLELLEDIAEHHQQERGFTPRLIGFRARALDAVVPRGRVLDLGCADGLLTRHLAAAGRSMVAVDASALRVERTRKVTEGLDVTVVQSYFEEFEPPGGQKFDGVVLGCILEHLDDPVSLLRRCSDWLTDTGVVAAVVPHGRSLHRRAGVHMGLLPDIEALGEADDALDHKRVYTIAMLTDEFERAGLTVVDTGGILLKPLPNSRMADLPDALVEAYAALGAEMPDLAAEIFAVGRR